MSTYQPGVCNIGDPQRRRRLWAAAAAFGVAVLYVVAYAMGYVPAALLPGVFVPLAVGFEYALQAYTAFCVRLALLNRYDFRRTDDGAAGSVSDPTARRADRIQAAKITVVAVLLSAVSTLVVVVALV